MASFAIAAAAATVRPYEIQPGRDGTRTRVSPFVLGNQRDQKGAYAHSSRRMGGLAEGTIERGVTSFGSGFSVRFPLDFVLPSCLTLLSWFVSLESRNSKRRYYGGESLKTLDFSPLWYAYLRAAHSRSIAQLLIREMAARSDDR